MGMKRHKYRKDEKEEVVNMRLKNVFFHSFWFEFEQKYIVYDYKHAVAMEVSKKMYDDLCKMEDDAYLDEIENDNINKLIQSDVLAGREKFIPKIKYYDIVSMSFAPIYGCNFRCKYCFGEHGMSYTGKEKTFSNESVVKAIDYFVFKLFPDAKLYRLDFVSGGEPLMNFKAVKTAVEYVEFVREEYKKNIQIWLCTNGSLLSKDICTYLDKKGVSIGVSIDGEKTCHNSNRIDENGNGTYELVVKKVKSILNDKDLSKKFRRVWILSVVSEKNFSFVSIMKHHINLGIRNMQMKLIRQKTNKFKAQDIEKEYYLLYRFLKKKFILGELDYFYSILNENDYFGKILKRVLQGRLYDRRCMAGVKKVSICPDGSIYPCDSFVGMKEMLLGNIFDSNADLEKFSLFNVDKRKPCSDCEIKYICGGDCYYNSYIKGGQISSPDTVFCEIQKYIVRLCIVLKLDMERYNANRLDKIVKGVNFIDDYNKV